MSTPETQFDLWSNNQQVGTLDYNKPPQLFVDNGKSDAVIRYDRRKVEERKQKKKGSRYGN